MNPVLKFFIDILSVPAVLLGVTALVGNIALRKPFSETLTSTVRATIGFFILSAGAITLSAPLQNLGVIVNQGFGVQGIVPQNEAIVPMILQELGQATALIMVMGFAFNILFALITPWKYIFLTGHHSLFMAGLLALELHLLGLDGLILILAGGAILGLLQVVMPAFGQKAITRVTGDTSYSIGHFNTLSYVLAGFIGEKLGNAQDSTENVKFPSYLEFLKDGMASTGITMFILFMVVELFATPQFIERNISQGQNWLVFAMVQAFIFSAGVSVVLYGVSISLKEIVPAFQGIAQKVIPNARPALDCPIVFPFAPNAMIIGFISSLAGGLISLVIMGMVGLPVVIPALVPHFFLGAVTAIIGNAYGGKRGAIAASFINGVITSFGAVLLLPYLGTYGAQNVSFSDSDFHWVGILLGTLRNFIQF